MKLSGVFERTQKGQDELRAPSHGLSPRAHQLLWLINGTARPTCLLTKFARYELFAYLAVLQAAGFISVGPNLKIPGTEPGDEAIDTLRDHALRQLLQTIGPAGEPFALRVAKCRNPAELQSLIPAMQSVVEVSRGPLVARQFAREIMPV